VRTSLTLHLSQWETRLRQPETINVAQEFHPLQPDRVKRLLGNPILGLVIILKLNPRQAADNRLDILSGQGPYKRNTVCYLGQLGFVFLMQPTA
jgi:hypothetical protein